MEYLNAAPATSQLDTFDKLHALAQEVALIDNHAHPIAVPLPSPSTSTFQLPKLASVLLHPTLPPSSLAFSRSIRDIHTLLSPTHRHDQIQDPSTSTATTAQLESEVEAFRLQLGPWDLAHRCLHAAKMSAVLIDDGIYCSSDVQYTPFADFQTKLNVPLSRRVLRLETEAEIVLSALCKATKESTVITASQFRTALRDRLIPLPHHVVSFKSIAAYRSSLNINLKWSDHDLEIAIQEECFSPDSTFANGGKLRLQHVVIIDCIVKEGMDIARQFGIPVQVHCGFGDSDVDINNADPALLRPLFMAYPDVTIVLLHGAWPFSRTAAFLAATYASVYVDFGLAIPMLSVRGMFGVVEQLFEIAPLNKIMYSSDAHIAPDVFYLASIWARKVIAAVAAASVASGDLLIDDAKTAILNILANNAIRLYKLPIALQTC